MSNRRRILLAAISVCGAALIVVCLAVSSCQRVDVLQPTGGMEPTITVGETVSVDYSAFDTARPGRWDVVVVRPPQLKGVEVPKRVIALPGESLQLTSTGIVVNGALLDFPDAVAADMYCPPEDLPAKMRTIVTFPYLVPSDHYFVVGDNWTNSLDSRHYGAVPTTSIIGRVELE